jgi:nicotinamidase-related amidase
MGIPFTMKPALLVIDVQKEFFKDPSTARSLDSAIEYINAAIALFRSKGLPVICIRHREDESGLIPGKEGFDLPDSLNVLATDIHIVKTYGNGFTKTSLAGTLRELGVDTVIITGYCAEFCVLSTCRGAVDQDLTPILMRNALASGTPDNIRFVESVNDLVSYGALKKLIE